MTLQAQMKLLPEKGMHQSELREWNPDEVEYYVALLAKHHYLGSHRLDRLSLRVHIYGPFAMHNPKKSS